MGNRYQAQHPRRRAYWPHTVMLAEDLLKQSAFA